MIAQYEIKDTLCKTSFGKVLLAEHNQVQYVIKVIEKHQNFCKHAKREIQALKRLHHANIIQLVDTMVSPTRTFIVTEYIDGVDLYTLLNRDGAMPEYDARPIFRQVCEGVGYCHTQGVCHRDIKPDNILIHKGHVYIIDFGMSNIFDTLPFMSTECGTPFYTAPEVNMGDKYDGTKSDVWSMGVVLYVALTTELPFESTKGKALAEEASRGMRRAPSLSEGVTRLLTELLHATPASRPSCAQILENYWVSNPIELI